MQVRQEALRNIMQFIGGAAEPEGLASEIETFERSVPQLSLGDNRAASHASNQERAALASAPAQRSEPSGIWGILREIVSLSGKLKAINNNIRQADALEQRLKQIQEPLRNQLKELAARTEAIMNQPDSQDPAILAQQKSALDAATGRYKLVCAAALPLSKEAILLELYKTNLDNWRNATKSQYAADIKDLLIRLSILGVLLGIVLAVFALWQHDPPLRPGLATPISVFTAASDCTLVCHHHGHCLWIGQPIGIALSGHPTPANDGHLKTGQRE